VPPPVLYAKSSDVNIAYQVVGDGPVDVLMIPGWVSHLALDWDEPRWVRWCERMTSFARLVRFDKRGTGLSDRPPGIPTPDERMEDAQAVMDAAGLEQAHVMGWSEGGPLAVMLATAHPERVSSLILYGTQAAFVRRDDYPFGDPPDERGDSDDELESIWGTVEAVLMTKPDAEPHFARRSAIYNQAAASPAAAVALARSNALLDIRPLLPSVRAPTLVLSRQGDPVGPPAAGRYMAERIPGATFVELDGNEHTMWLGDSEALCGEIEGFVTGVRPHTPEPGVVRAILQSDIEGSTVLASELGNERWADLLLEYGSMTEKVVGGYGGRIVDQIGDGLMVEFDGPVNAIRSAQRLRTTADEIGLAVRSGIHVGEVLERDGALRGIAVHVAARVMSKAGGGEILVSQTTKDICGGSGLEFTEHGEYALKGVEGTWRLFAIA
jgi:pimeloyl-ACP methyl ester carboxylesterase/class 3 adenylate cyclase